MPSSTKKSTSLEESVRNISAISGSHVTHGDSEEIDKKVVSEFLEIQHIQNVIRPDLMIVANLSNPLPFLYEKNYSLNLGTKKSTYAEMTRFIASDTIMRSDIIDRKIVEFAYRHKLKPYDFVYQFYYEIKSKNPKLTFLKRTVLLIASDENGFCTHCAVYINDISDQVSGLKFPGYEISFKPEKKHLEGELYEFISAELSAPHNITPRENEIIHKLKSGMSSKMIAKELGISKNTVDTHRRKLLKKFKVSNTAGLLSKVNELGII